MKLILTVAVIAAVVALGADTVTARRVKKPIEQIAQAFSDFAGEDDIDLIINDDNRPPTNYVGDVMKAQTTSIKQLTGAKKFNYNFETQNGINVASIGKLKDGKTFVVSGSYSYTGADGKKYRVRYTADEFGYHPVTEEDNEPDPVPAPTPAPARVAPYPSAGNGFGNQFGNQFGRNNLNSRFGNRNGRFGANGQLGKNGLYGDQSSYNGNEFNGYDSNAQEISGNGLDSQNGQNGQFGRNGQFGANGQFGGRNGNGNGNGRFGNTNNQYGRNNQYGGQNAFGRSQNGFGQGFNTYNQYGSYDRTGKSFQTNDLVFNRDFISAKPVAHEPNRLYLPTA